MSKNGSAIPRRRLGSIMREMRQAVGLTIEQAANLMGRSATTLQRLETGRVNTIEPEDIEAFCQVVGADEETAVALQWLAKQANTSDWFYKYNDVIPQNFGVYLGLESVAVKLSSFVELVPGLLQTAEYARALFRASYPRDTESEIERRVKMRMHRQVLITRKYRPATLDVILDESVLHRNIGGRKVMAAQLRHLADMGTKPNIRVRVLPLSKGAPLGDLTGPFIILDFDETARGSTNEPPVVYVENYTGEMFFDDQETLACYREAHATLGRVALDDRPSRDLLRRIAAKESAL